MSRWMDAGKNNSDGFLHPSQSEGTSFIWETGEGESWVRAEDGPEHGDCVIKALPPTRYQKSMAIRIWRLEPKRRVKGHQTT